ncbi:MAG TPA: hypothetical protein VEK86_04250 [Gemmatimonadales bacterium]|nr:hypothetical protein [Gemmatimonadales bacterium]
MNRLWSGLTLLLLAAPLAAQQQPCSSIDPNTTRACRTAVDAVRAFYPLAGMIVSGGNPVLGTSGSLGGVGHVFVTTRVNVIKASLPDPDSASQSSVPSSFDGAVPAPIVEAGLGLLRGSRRGLLAVDALGSAVLLPTGVVNDLSVDPDAPRIGSVALGLGFGGRVSLLHGGFPIPSLSVSVMRRLLPRIQYGTLAATLGASGDQFEFDTDLTANNYRLAAGWRLALVDLAAGVGVDHYTGTAHIRYHDNPALPTGVRVVTLGLHNTRELLFLNAGLRLGGANLVGELGYQTGEDQQLSTTFSDFDPKAGHLFGGLGFRFGF